MITLSATTWTGGAGVLRVAFEATRSGRKGRVDWPVAAKRRARRAGVSGTSAGWSFRMDAGDPARCPGLCASAHNRREPGAPSTGTTGSQTLPHLGNLL